MLITTATRMITMTINSNLKTKWGNRFIIAAIIQGGIVTAMALVTVAFQLITTSIDIIEFLSLSFEGPAKWFFIGSFITALLTDLLYLILIVAIAVTAVFYNHLEINLNGYTILMIFAGLTGSGVLSLFIEGKLGNQDVGIMNSFIPFIAFFIVVLSIGVICGGATYLIAYRSTD
jgi:hypothetical protein